MQTYLTLAGTNEPMRVALQESLRQLLPEDHSATASNSPFVQGEDFVNQHGLLLSAGVRHTLFHHIAANTQTQV